MSSVRNSKLIPDLAMLDKLVSSIIQRQQQQQTQIKSSQKPLGSSSLRRRSRTDSMKRRSPGEVSETGGLFLSGLNTGSGNNAATTSVAMPTILETNMVGHNGGNRSSWSSDGRVNNIPGVRQIINTITNAPHRFSQGGFQQDEENTNLTNNMLD